MIGMAKPAALIFATDAAAAAGAESADHRQLQKYNIDGDNHVDLEDFAALQRNWGG